MTAAPVELDIDGPAAPPRSNGELVFSAPWESRTFGMAMALYDAEAFAWDDFRDALVARISTWEAKYSEGPPEGECYSYYQCWQGALEDTLAVAGLVGTDALVARGEELAARPAGYDHAHGDDDGDEHGGHGHGHGHGH